ncbi:ParA family protein [Salinicoccus kekensis]|uniref:Cellulose biosynthesis protein BcsQ n=1 Tax=Salinicoccus kekensis TaxID=714307 RepID=A0A285UTF7_9STAP|nr:ParA family protein [Salinicoccus kekensis]SOC45083.1 cellulose biosynthesis protein BcsQ [Salinicoccus kekensis]
MTKIISFSNYKGGVGKSTITEIFGFLLDRDHDKKVLLIDTDPQMNLSDKIRRTFNVEAKPKKQLMQAIEDQTIADARVTINDNIDLLVGDWQIEKFPQHVAKLPAQAQFYLLYTLTKDIVKEYEYVLIDTRPSTDIMTNNAIAMSDYVLIVAKTEQDSFISSQRYYKYLSEMQRYNENLKLLGVIQYLVNTRGSTDKKVMQDFAELFEEDVLKSIIRSSERVKTWGYYGITTNYAHDKKTMKMYQEALNEVLEKLEKRDEDVPAH